jgi:general secretion pathway protein C
MPAQSRSIWFVRAATALVWALAAGAAVFWGLRLSVPAGASAASIRVPAGLPGPAVDPGALARSLGAAPVAVAGEPAVALVSRFNLLGVVAGTPGRGAALVAVDGKPARPVRVGAAIEPGLVLQSVGARWARFGREAQGEATLTLEMPPLPR